MNSIAKTIVFSLVLQATACHTVMMKRQTLPFNEGYKNQECLQKAVKSVPSVEFTSQNSLKNGCIFDCPQESFYTHYTVKNNLKFKEAHIIVSNSNNKFSYSNSNYAYLNQKVPDTELNGYEEAINAVNKAVQLMCLVK